MTLITITGTKKKVCRAFMPVISSEDGANFLIVSAPAPPTLPPAIIIMSSSEEDELSDEVEEEEFRELEESVPRRAFLRTLLRRWMIAAKQKKRMKAICDYTT